MSGLGGAAVRDQDRVRRMTRSVGLYVAVASAIATAIGTLALLGAIALTSRHEDGEISASRPQPNLHHEVHWVVDRNRIVLLVIIAAVLGVLLLGAVGWLAARRAVAPLAEALRVQRNFVADASHELRTPLTVLDGRIQVLQRRLSRGEPAGEVAAQLRSDASAMSAVLGDLLLAAEHSERHEDAATEVVPVVRSAVASLAPLADAAGVRVQVEVPDAGLVATVPEVPLSRCVVALLDNALQHAPRGSAVTVSVAPDGEQVVVRVADQGPGIRGIGVEEVFERFSHGPETGRRRGFGLGLSLVRDVARRVGGTVDVESTSESGTTFALRLPLAR
ncbi:MAG: HAMP domain-containing histidine kinase [Promicromonosporaceae bacterium]|nr:HAMP domain-containing histidine kinase [Promicromonosporaceae bacterium]